MASPARERVIAAGVPRGTMSQSGVSRLLQAFAPKESAKSFQEWASHPTTEIIRTALRDLALNGGTGASDPLVAYGVTCGLSLAAQLLEDPSVVYPGLFLTDGGATGPKFPEPDFTGDPETVLFSASQKE